MMKVIGVTMGDSIENRLYNMLLKKRIVVEQSQFNSMVRTIRSKVSNGCSLDCAVEQLEEGLEEIISEKLKAKDGCDFHW